MVTKERLDKLIEQMDRLSVATGTTSSYLQTITDFSAWSTNTANNFTANLENDIDDKIDDIEIYLKEHINIFEDFVKSNEHIIQKINKVKK